MLADMDTKTVAHSSSALDNKHIHICLEAWDYRSDSVLQDKPFFVYTRSMYLRFETSVMGRVQLGLGESGEPVL